MPVSSMRLAAVCALSLAACTGEAHVVPGPGSGGRAANADAESPGDGGSSNAGGGGTHPGGGAPPLGGAPPTGGAGGTRPGGGGPGAGGAPPPPPEGGPPGCQETVVKTATANCDSCAVAQCPSELSACNGDPACVCQASCLLSCPTITGRPQEQDACAANCPPGSLAAMAPGVKTLLLCLAPPGTPPACLPCFHPPPP